LFSLATVTTFAQFIIAQGAGAPASQPARPWWAAIFESPIFLIVPFVLLYIFMISSKRKQERQKRDQLNSIKRGDRVQTIGGILGKVVEADENKVLLKVDESSNTKIWFSRNAIARVLDEEKPAEAREKERA
jgi:preprotein translocase subunit YajC